MRRSLLAVLLVAALVPAGCARSVNGRPGAQPSIFFLGDSITANYYAAVAARGYRADFVRSVGGRQAGVVGGPGFTTAQALAETAGVAPTGADTVVVEVGTNDLVKGTPLTGLDGTYVQLIGAALALSAPHPTLLCLGVWEMPELADAYDAVLRQVCTAAGGHFVAVSDLYEQPALHGPVGAASYLGPADLFHPNDRGHAAIAQRLATAFRAARP